MWYEQHYPVHAHERRLSRKIYLFDNECSRDAQRSVDKWTVMSVPQRGQRGRGQAVPAHGNLAEDGRTSARMEVFLP